MVSPQLRRQAVVVMRSEVAVSERRACGLIEIYRRTYRYVPRPEDPRLRVRYEKRPDLHEAFLSLGCALICWNALASCAREAIR